MRNPFNYASKTFFLIHHLYRSSRPEVFCKKGFLRNSQENTCDRVSFLIKLQACNFIKKGTLAQLLCYELCEHLRTPKNSFSYRTLPVVASGHLTTHPKHFSWYIISTIFCHIWRLFIENLTYYWFYYWFVLYIVANLW